jgi:hypothetical protein
MKQVFEKLQGCPHSLLTNNLNLHHNNNLDLHHNNNLDLHLKRHPAASLYNKNPRTGCTGDRNIDAQIQQPIPWAR